MKIEWQIEDIQAGRIVGKPDRIERWMIGYLPGERNQNKWALVSLADGMVIQTGSTAEQMCSHLNTSGDVPIEFFSDPDHRKRGMKGGAARAASLSPERRSEIAAQAANARWNGERLMDPRYREAGNE